MLRRIYVCNGNPLLTDFKEMPVLRIIKSDFHFNRKIRIIPAFHCILLYFIIISACTSCISAKKVDKWVAKKYKDAPTPRIRKGSENISVASALPGMGDAYSTSNLKMVNFLPLLVYWQFENRTTCRLNPQLAINNFSNTVRSYHMNALQQKLNGARLELNIEKLPGVFVISDKEHIIWVIYAFSWIKLSIQPEKQNMQVSYKVISPDNTVIKTGQLTISNPDKGISLGLFQSIRKKTWDYLDQYDANITAMSKKIVDELLKDL